MQKHIKNRQEQRRKEQKSQDKDKEGKLETKKQGNKENKEERGKDFLKKQTREKWGRGVKEKVKCCRTLKKRNGGTTGKTTMERDEKQEKVKDKWFGMKKRKT